MAVLRPVAALPLVKFETPEPRGFARRVGNSLVDAADISRSKTDSGQFSAPSGISIKIMFEQASSVSIHLAKIPKKLTPFRKATSVGVKYLLLARASSCFDERPHMAHAGDHLLR